MQVWLTPIAPKAEVIESHYDCVCTALCMTYHVLLGVTKTVNSKKNNNNDNNDCHLIIIIIIIVIINTMMIWWTWTWKAKGQCTTAIFMSAMVFMVISILVWINSIIIIIILLRFMLPNTILNQYTNAMIWYICDINIIQ